MPLVKLWCLPKLEEGQLNNIHQGIVRAFKDNPELEINTEKDIVVLFVPDMMKYGLGTEVICEINGMFDKPSRTKKVRDKLAQDILSSLTKNLGSEESHITEKIEVIISPPFDLNTGSFATKKFK